MNKKASTIFFIATALVILLLLFFFFFSEFASAFDNSVKENKEGFIKHSSINTDLYKDNGHFKKVIYAGAVNVPVGEQFVAFEDYITFTENSDEVSWETIDGKKLKFQYFEKEKNKVKTKIKDKADKANLKTNINKNKGSIYYNITQDKNSKLEEFGFELNTSDNIEYGEDYFIWNDLKFDFSQAIKEQGLNFSKNRDLKEISFKGEDLSYIDPTITYFANGTNNDSFVNSGNPTTNYGDISPLIVGRSYTQINRAFIYFDLSSFSKDNAINSANLSIYKSTCHSFMNDNETFLVYTSASSWAENSITWDNQPGGSVYIKNFTIPSADASSTYWVNVSVTSAVKGFINGSYSNYGFFIYNSDEEDINSTCDFYSAEDGSGLYPSLIIDYEGLIINTPTSNQEILNTLSTTLNTSQAIYNNSVWYTWNNGIKNNTLCNNSNECQATITFPRQGYYNLTVYANKSDGTITSKTVSNLFVGNLTSNLPDNDTQVDTNTADGVESSYVGCTTSSLSNSNEYGLFYYNYSAHLPSYSTITLKNSTFSYYFISSPTGSSLTIDRVNSPITWTAGCGTIGGYPNTTTPSQGNTWNFSSTIQNLGTSSFTGLWATFDLLEQTNGILNGTYNYSAFRTPNNYFNSQFVMSEYTINTTLIPKFNLTYYSQNTAPSITNTLVNNSNFSISNVNFTFNISDDNDYLTNISLILDGAINSTILTPTINVSTNNSFSFNVTGLSDGTHTWYIQAYDSDGAQSNSSTFSILVDLENITVCRNLITSNRIYNLLNDVQATAGAPCFNITANNITFNGNGKTVNFSMSGVSMQGIIAISNKNITIINTTFYTAGTNRASAIHLQNINDYSYINNISITEKGNSLTSYPGIWVQNCSNNYINNSFINTSGSSEDGVHYFSGAGEYSENITINSLKIITSGSSSYGVYYDTSMGSGNLYNNIAVLNTNVTTSGTSSGGIYTTTNTGRTINNTLIDNFKFIGLGASSSSHGIVVNVRNGGGYFNISNSDIATYSGASGISIGYYGNLFIKNTNISGASLGIRLVTGAQFGAGVTVLNTTYSADSVAEGVLTRKWYFDAQVNYTHNGTAVPGASVIAYNVSGAQQFSVLTDSTGKISQQQIIEYIKTASTKSDYNNYTINASFGSWATDSRNLNITSSILQQFSLSDLTSPSLTIIHPPNGASFTTGTIDLNYTVADSLTGLSSCWYRNNTDENNITLACGVNTTISQGSDGTYTVYMWANDSVNNVASTQAVWTVSTDAPATTTYIPADLSWHNNGANFYFNFTSQDGNGIDTCELWGNWTGTWHKNQSKQFSGDTSVNISEGFFIQNISDGYYIWNVWCNDTATPNKASFATLNKTFGVDSILPSLTLFTPQNITYTTNTLYLNYSASDLNRDTCWYNINGTINITLSNCNNISFTANQGTSTLNLFVNDSANNINSTAVTFFVDSILPSVSIDSAFSNGSYLNYNTSINLTLTITDTNLQSCWYNDNNGANSSFTCGDNLSLSFQDETFHTITVFANDTLNNVNSNTISFRVDSLPPRVSITSPSNGSANALTFTFNYNVSDTYISTCSFNLYDATTGLPAFSPNQSLTCSENGSKETTIPAGTYDFYVYATDLANNANSSVIRVSFSEPSAPTGGGGAITSTEKFAVIGIMGDFTRSYTNLEKEVAYARINDACGSKETGSKLAIQDFSGECSLTLEDISVIQGKISDLGFSIEQTDILSFFKFYNEKKFFQGFETKEIINKYILFTSILGITNPLRTDPPSLDRPFLISKSEGNMTISHTLRANKNIRTCEVISEDKNLKCVVLQNSTFRVSYDIQDVRFLSKIFSGQVAVASDGKAENQEIKTVSVAMRVYNISYKLWGIPIWMVLGIALLTSVSLVFLYRYRSKVWEILK
jgi:hypothetical protein